MLSGTGCPFCWKCLPMVYRLQQSQAAISDGSNSSQTQCEKLICQGESRISSRRRVEHGSRARWNISKRFAKPDDGGIWVVWLVHISHYMWDELSEEREHFVSTTSGLTSRAIILSAQYMDLYLCSAGYSRHLWAPILYDCTCAVLGP